MKPSSVTSTINLNTQGVQYGDLRVKWSDNSIPLGYHPVPIISIKNGTGPVALLIGGTHGDEFEGPSALMRLASDLQLDKMSGQVIILPSLNSPAVKAASRVSPLDNENLNRAFPGNPDGNITQQVAYYVETVLLPKANIALDLHSGGQASFFQPSSLATRTQDNTLFQQNIDLAKAFGLPLLWILGALNDDRALNSAAERNGVPMIATELGGGGGVDPSITNAAEAGLYGVLKHIGILKGDIEAVPTEPLMVELKSIEHSIYAPSSGLFDRRTQAGDHIVKGDVAGILHYPNEPRRASEKILFPYSGYVLAHTNRGYVQHGDLLALVAQTTHNNAR